MEAWKISVLRNEVVRPLFVAIPDKVSPRCTVTVRAELSSLRSGAGREAEDRAWTESLAGCPAPACCGRRSRDSDHRSQVLFGDLPARVPRPHPIGTVRPGRARRRRSVPPAALPAPNDPRSSTGSGRTGQGGAAATVCTGCAGSVRACGCEQQQCGGDQVPRRGLRQPQPRSCGWRPRSRAAMSSSTRPVSSSQAAQPTATRPVRARVPSSGAVNVRPSSPRSASRPVAADR